MKEVIYWVWTCCRHCPKSKTEVDPEQEAIARVGCIIIFTGKRYFNVLVAEAAFEAVSRKHHGGPGPGNNVNKAYSGSSEYCP